MKILYLVEFFPKNDASKITGGVESRYFFLTKQLRLLAQTVEVIARCQNPNQWTYSSWTSVPSRFLYLITGTIKALQTNFDIIEGTNFTNYPIAWLVGKLKRKPVIFCYHDVFLGSWIKNTGLIGVMGEIAERIILLLPVDGYVAVSQSTKDKMVQYGVPAEKIKVVHNGINPDEYKLKNIKTSTDVVCVSRLVSYKRVADLVLAAKQIRISLTIIGQGPELTKLQNLDKDTKFLGFIPKHEDVLKTIAGAKVFCSPSTVEGFGISALESAALGIPMVLSDIPAFREVTKNGQGALLFKPENVKDLGLKLKELLSDKKLWQQKSMEAKRLAKNYYWPDLAKKLLVIYQDL